MGMKAKNKAREKRKLMKRTRKAAKAAQYEAWKLAGQNQKSKRFMKKGKTKLLRSKHWEGPCGNTGCMKCSDLFAANGPLYLAKVEHEKNQSIQVVMNLSKWERTEIAVKHNPLIRVAA